MLKVESIKKYKSPGYPDKKVVLENPDILKTLPQRWKDKAFVGLAIPTIALLVLTGCQRYQDNVTAGTPLPPIYLTEEEACNIIIEEAAKYGVSFDKSGFELKNVPFQLKKPDADSTTPFVYKFNVQLDGFDKEKAIGFEFVSQNDIDEFNNNVQHVNNMGLFSIWMDEYSNKLEEAIKENDEKIFFDAFYSSGTGIIEDQKKDLREQVKSFMEWLKVQGVI